MARDPGNTLRSARSINLAANAKSFEDRVSPTDRLDVYRFSLGDRSAFNLRLKGLQANANVALLDQKGRVLRQPKRPGRQAETIQALLNAGTYYIRISQEGNANTRYQLIASATPTNTAPLLVVNTGLTVARGTLVFLTKNLLQTRAPEQSSSQLFYTLTEQPQNGRLQRDGQILQVGSTFTQAEIDSGRLAYQSIGKVQLTNNTTFNSAPYVDGSRMVWTGRDGNDFEIYFYDYLSNITTQLTNNSTLDQSSRISGNYVAWNGNDGQDDEIILYNLQTGVKTQITNNDQVQDRLIAMSSNNLVWSASDDKTNSSTLMLYDGSTGKIVQLGKDNFLASTIGLSVSGNKVAWIHYKDDLNQPNDAAEEVFFYDGVTTRQLTNNIWFESNPRVMENGVVWMGFDGNDNEIYLFDGTTQVLTNNATQDADVTVFGNRIAWVGVNNSNNEVYVYEEQTTIQITNTPASEYGVRLSGSAIVWETDPTWQTTSIFFYDGVKTTQLVDSGLRNGLGNLSGDTVGWANFGANERDAFFYNGARSDRFSFSVSDRTGNAIAGTFNITIN